MVNYSYGDDNRFIIEDYLNAKTFASFLPGIAGTKGIPIWSFYVNRGQGICSFGIQDKDSPIMEFYPANGAYQNVSVIGFRTFIKLIGDETVIYEPFANNKDAATKMTVMKDRLIIEEVNESLGLKVEVNYTTLSHVPFGGLVRKTVVTNLKNEHQDIEVIDGMPALLPYGVTNESYKEMSNLVRSWMEVSHTDTKIPFYKLRASTKDEAVVSEVNSGYFFMNESLNDTSVVTVYDPSLIFEQRVDLQYPEGFSQRGIKEMGAASQVYANKVPCAFQVHNLTLAPKSDKVINSVYGFAYDYESLALFADKLSLKNFVDKQFEATGSEVEAISNEVATKTGIKALDAYITQNYLDNVLRGGKPIIFEGDMGNHVYHVFSRKHGDLERDYNFFSLEPAMYSSGNGNYRDVCQNRRNDVVINPEVKDYNVQTFYSLIQADGYNPLSIKGSKFTISEEAIPNLKKKLTKEGVSAAIVKKILVLVKESFTPGSMINSLKDITGNYTEADQIMHICMSVANQSVDVAFGEGFWSDHFTYNLDLIKTYEYMYPDKLNKAFFDKYSYRFYNAPVYVRPRKGKYNKIDYDVIRQYEAVAEKENDVNEWLTDEKGVMVETNLFNKMLVLALTKFMNIDPFGMGIEMEGERPGWNDALNGLPGLFGSGMSETVELKRVVDYLIERVTEMDGMNGLTVLTALIDLMDKIKVVLSETDVELIHEASVISFRLWDKLNEIKEDYRASTKYTMSGMHQRISHTEVISLLATISDILGRGIEKAKMYAGGVLPSYFINEVTSFEELSETTAFGKPAVKVLAFKNRPLPLFLEAPARYMKTISGAQAEQLYENIKETDIYDKLLGMYKTSESLDSESMEIGRIRAFTPGWLERESIFLHMTYKYMLSLLDAKLYDVFFDEMKKNIIPFLDPNVYGRPTTENSSFIASDVNPDKSVIGQGFVSRLSGSTAEFISMWVKMFIGNRGFKVKGDKLTFKFAPILAGEFFDEHGEIAFKLFGTTEVKYVNKAKKHTFGQDKAEVVKVIIDGEEMASDLIEDKWAHELRNGNVKNIEVVFA